MDPPPFFIVGCGRSGTTLIRTALNLHSRIAIPFESLFLVDYLRVAQEIPLPRLIKGIREEYELQEWGLDTAELKLEALATLPEVIERLHLAYGGFRKDIWGQKTPRYIRHLDLIEHFFPGSRYIHVIRDPRAVAASLIRSPAHVSTSRHAALRWRVDVMAGLSFERCYPDRLMRIRYEELVTAFPQTIQKICRFIGVEVEAEMLRAHQFREELYSRQYYRSMHRNLRGGIRMDRIDSWREELTPREVATVEFLCGELMEYLGYPCQRVARPLPGWYAALDRSRGIMRQASHYLRYRRGYLYGAVRRKWLLGLWWKDISHMGALNR